MIVSCYMESLAVIHWIFSWKYKWVFESPSLEVHGFTIAEHLKNYIYQHGREVIHAKYISGIHDTHLHILELTDQWNCEIDMFIKYLHILELTNQWNCEIDMFIKYLKSKAHLVDCSIYLSCIYVFDHVLFLQLCTFWEDADRYVY